MTFRSKGTKNREQRRALTAMSVQTIEEAQSLRILVCKHQLDGRWVLNPDLRPGGIEDMMERVAPALEGLYQKYVKEK